VWPPVRWTSTPGATSYSFSNGRIWLWYSFKNRLLVSEARLGTLAAWRRGRSRATPRTWPRRPPGGPAGPDAAGPSPPVDEQPATVVHVQVGKHHVESRVDRTAGGERADAGGRTPS
jgi:hypothetical protein